MAIWLQSGSSLFHNSVSFELKIMKLQIGPSSSLEYDAFQFLMARFWGSSGFIQFFNPIHIKDER